MFDPPFFGVKLAEMRRAVQYLVGYDPRAKIIVTYLARRQRVFLRAFRDYDLRTAGEAFYTSVKLSPKTRVWIFSNFLDPWDPGEP